MVRAMLRFGESWPEVGLDGLAGRLASTLSIDPQSEGPRPMCMHAGTCAGVCPRSTWDQVLP